MSAGAGRSAGISAFVASFCLLISCGQAPLEPLPEVATATGLVVRSTADNAQLSVHLAGAEGNLVAGAPIHGTATVVSKTETGRPPLEINAARSDWNLRDHTAAFDDHVVVTRGDVTLTCTHLDVRYAGTEQIESVVASGGVHVVKGQRTASADHADLDGKTGRVTLTGSPRLAEGASELVGTTITLWLDDERATCEGDQGQGCRLVVAGSAIGR